MKVKAKIYKGIEFISVGDLPINQQLLLQHNEEPERIKILVDGKVIENCVQYREYEQWYSSVYKRSVSSDIPVKEEPIKVKLSLHKA